MDSRWITVVESWTYTLYGNSVVEGNLFFRYNDNQLFMSQMFSFSYRKKRSESMYSTSFPSTVDFFFILQSVPSLSRDSRIDMGYVPWIETHLNEYFLASIDSQHICLKANFVKNLPFWIVGLVEDLQNLIVEVIWNVLELHWHFYHKTVSCWTQVLDAHSRHGILVLCVSSRNFHVRPVQHRLHAC